MLWGAILGWVIFSALGGLQDTWRHQGVGYVSHEDGEPERVSETKYKRIKYAENGFMLVLGLYVWACVAYCAKDKKQEKSPRLPPY